MWGRCERDALRTDTISHNPGTHRMTGQPTLTSRTGARGQRWNCLASSAARAMGKSQGEPINRAFAQLRGMTACVHDLESSALPAALADEDPVGPGHMNALAGKSTTSPVIL
jgi:hypothetical protein